MDGAQRGFEALTHALFVRENGHSETTCDNTSVTYVFAFNDFYGAAKWFAVPDPRIVQVRKWLQRNQVRERSRRVCD
jgi:hypothetical protein